MFKVTVKMVDENMNMKRETERRGGHSDEKWTLVKFSNVSVEIKNSLQP